MLSTENAKDQSELREDAENPVASSGVSNIVLASAIRYLAEKLSPVEKETFKNMFPALYGREK